jgi:pre-mRNA-splicing factor CWC26
MPNAALNAYLAKNYLDGEKAEAYLSQSGDHKKKRRKKTKEDGDVHASGSGFRLIDDSEIASLQRHNDDEIDLENAEVVQLSTSTASAGEKWNRVGNTVSQDAAAAQGNERESQAHPSAAHNSGEPSTSSGVRAGLKSREQMRAERLEREKRLALEAVDRADGTSDTAEQRRAQLEREREQAQQETVYRDASGRRVDVKKEEEEELRRQRARERLEREKEDWNKGEVQQRQARERARREQEERSTAFARHANDERMNATLRNVERAEDPAARFLSRKQSAQSAGQRPTYKGSFPPNRYNIKPGYRWDGVERSNGFETKLFQRRNERSRRKTEMQGEYTASLCLPHWP